MSFLYPRTISITRPQADPGLGKVGYGGETPRKECLVVDDVQASIQIKGTGGAPEPSLPGNASRRTYWRILIPLGAVRSGTIFNRDIVTDDLGIRYQVTGDYWNSMGYNLLAERLET